MQRGGHLQLRLRPRCCRPGNDVSEYPEVIAWLRRVEQQPGFIDDLIPYPENTLSGRGSSNYDH